MNNLFPNDINGGAVFSDCRKYRYVLWRNWDVAKPTIMFIGLNPSTANEDQNDATIRRVIRFAKDWGYGGVYMCNCFPYVSTNPDELKDFGNDTTNDYWLRHIEKEVKNIVFAWGNFNIVKEMGRDIELCKMFPNAKTIIKNKDGSPRHPLYISSKATLINYQNER